MHLLGTTFLFSYYTLGTAGVISGQLLRKVDLVKGQDRLMDGSGGRDNLYGERIQQEDEAGTKLQVKKEEREGKFTVGQGSSQS